MLYDFFEASRQGNEWLGATAKAFWSNPVFGLSHSPLPATFSAWGQVTERAFSRVNVRPDWGIDSVVSKGREYVVTPVVEMEKPFCRLLHFKTSRPDPMPRKILLVAPMSGHYATLLRKTVQSLLPNCSVYITDWRNARNIPVSHGKFDVETYTKYLIEFMQFLGSDTNVIAVCQPVPLTMAATAWLAEHDPKSQPSSLVLMGGPADPDAAPTEVTAFSDAVTMDQLENSFIQPVGVSYEGFGRRVYPGYIQLFSFMTMNKDSHMKSFFDQIMDTAKGEAHDLDRHNVFYDEYLAVMDMTAEFYLSTVKRIFKDREIARNVFSIDGKPIDLGKVKDVAVKVIEGELDDISAPGQCAAALDLFSGVPKDKKALFVQPKAGHYGIFSGRAWTDSIRPQVLDFIDQHTKKA